MAIKELKVMSVEERIERGMPEFVSWYEKGFRKKPKRGALRKTGLEKEYPVVDAATFEAADVRPLFPELVNRLGGTLTYDDVYEDSLVGCEVPLRMDGKEYIIPVTTDAGICTLEVALPPTDTLEEAIHVRRALKHIIVPILRQQGKLLLGCGIQPITRGVKDLWTPKGRYDLILRSLSAGVYGVSATAADQFHVDVFLEEIATAMNVLHAFAPAFIRLAANSPVHCGRVDISRREAPREQVWSDFAPRRSGIPPRPFHDTEDFLRYALGQSIFVGKGINGEYIIPDQRMPFRDVLIFDVAWKNQWPWHEGTLWFCARPRRIGKGTIEFRPACSQNGTMSAAVAAAALGVMEDLDEAHDITRQFAPWDEYRRLYRSAIYGTEKDRATLDELARLMIGCARRGSQKRGRDEEKYLEPLEEHLENGTNPARIARDIFEKRGMKAYVEHVAIAA